MRKNTKKIAILCLAVLLLVSLSITAFAATQTGYFNNGFNYVGQTRTVTLYNSPTSNLKYTATGVSGATGNIVLKFSSTSTGQSQTVTFIVDGGTYTRNPLNVNSDNWLKPGTYNVTVVTKTCDVNVMQIWFYA